MTTAYNPAEVERLAHEGKTHAEAMGAIAPACTCSGAAFCEDWCPCYPWAVAQGAGYDWCDANLRAMADQLEAARAEVERLRSQAEFAERADEHKSQVIAELVAERDALQSLLAANAETYQAQRRELDAQSASLAAVRHERDGWEAEARRARTEVDQLRARVAGLEKLAATADRAIASLQQQGEQARARIAELETAARDRANDLTAPASTSPA